MLHKKTYVQSHMGTLHTVKLMSFCVCLPLDMWVMYTCKLFVIIL